MAGCNTGRNIQKYKGAAASTLQDALENGNTASLNINLSSPAVFIGDGGGLSNISASAVAGNLQAVTDNGAATTNKITLTNGLTSLVTSGNVLVTGNVTASFFSGDGGTLSNIAANKNFQEVTDLGATSSNKITLTNSATSLQTTGKIVSLTLEANVNASNIVTNDGRGINQLNASNVSIGTLAIARGGTGAGSASAAASALGVGTEDSPSFVTVNANVNASNVVTNDGSGINQLNASNVSIGEIPITRGGTGATSASAAATALGVGTGDKPSFVTVNANVNASNVVSSDIYGTIQGSNLISSSTVNAITLNANVISNNIHGEIRGSNLISSSTVNAITLNANVNASNIVTADGRGINQLNASNVNTGTLIIARGGTGATTAPAAATALGVGVGDQPSFVTVNANVNASNIVTNDGRGINQLNASNVSIGTLAITRGGTGADSASAAATALGVGTGDSPSFVTMNANVNAINVVSTDIYGTIQGSNTVTAITLNANVNASNIVTNDGRGINQLNASNVSIGTLAITRGGTGQTSYNVGDILVANTVSGSVTLTKLPAGSSGYFLKSTGNGSFPTWGDVSSVGSATPGQLFTGFGLTGANATGNPPTGGHTGAGNTTIAADATTTNTANKLVARDDLGDIYVSNVSSSSNVNAITLKANVIASNIVTNDGRGINQLNASNVSIGTIAIARGGTGAETASAAASALGVGTEDSPQFTAIELGHATDTTLARSSAGVVTIEGVEIRTGTVPVTKGGTGLDTVTGGDILYASANDTIAALNKGSNGEYLRLAGGIPDWHENIAAKITAVDSTSSSQLPVPFMSAATGDVTVNSDSGALQYQASSGTLSSTIFSGSGASLTNLPASELTGDIASARLPTVPVTKGGTGLDTVTAGDILYASANDTIAGLDKGDNGQFLTLSDGLPAWATVSVSSTTISTTDVTIEDTDTDHFLIFVSDSGTGAQALKKEYGTLKYKPSTGTLTTSNVITSDTSIHARNGIANTTPTHTLSVGTVVSIQETASGDVIIVRGNGYFSDEVYIAKKLTIPVGGQILADKITVRSLETKGSIVFANRPPTSGIVLS
jgi:hypothetical protein